MSHTHAPAHSRARDAQRVEEQQGADRHDEHETGGTQAVDADRVTFGVKGVGEIGLVGMAAPIANAVYHATGKRIRSIPITLERLL